MGRLAIGVVANCQSHPLAAAIRQSAPGAETTVVTIHLAKEEEAQKTLEALSKCDFIVAQKADSPAYASFLQHQALARHFGDKLITIPNIYFTGYTPDLIYVHSASRRHVVPGPLTDYHSKSIVKAYQSDLPIEEAVKLFRSGILVQDARRIASDSIAELQRREESCDVSISDFLEQYCSSVRTMWTFNHPTNYAISELAIRVLNLARISALNLKSYSITERYFDELLVRAVPAIPEMVYSALEMRFPNPRTHRGVVLKLDDGKWNTDFTLRYFDDRELVEAYFRIYNDYRDDIQTVETGILELQ